MLEIVSKKGVVANMIDSMDKSARVQFVAFVTWRRPRARLVPQIRSRSLGLSAISPKRIHRPSTSAQQGRLLQRINPMRAQSYKTNLQSDEAADDEDEPSPTRPFFLCRTLLRNWRWASVHLLQGARTAHQVCAHCTWHNAHMAGEERTASLTGGERMADDDAHIHGQVPQV